MIVPGLAVRSYVQPPADALRRHGYEVDLLEPPAWRGSPTDLRDYGERLAAAIERHQRPVSVLVGLSVGTQAAAVAAAASDRVERLLLVSPTVPPELRNRPRLLARFFLGSSEHPDSPTFRSQLPDWRQAGARRILAGFGSAIDLHLEYVLPDVGADLTVVHADTDQLTSHAFAAALAAEHGGRLLLAPNAPHSWPIGDHDRFLGLIDELTGDR